VRSNDVVQGVLGSGLAVLSLVYWWLVSQRWSEPFRRWCERRYDVDITIGVRGHWQVSGSGSAFRRFAIGWLQLGYFMAAMVAWSIGLMIGLGGLYLLD
jgi:hypothetical protein